MAEPKLTKSRRKLLKSIALGGGAIAVGKTLPQSWTRPVVESVMLPAHAQASVPSVLSFSGQVFDSNSLTDNTDANDKSLLAKVMDSVVPEAKADHNLAHTADLCIEVNGSSCSIQMLGYSGGRHYEGSGSIAGGDFEVELTQTNICDPEYFVLASGQLVGGYLVGSIRIDFPVPGPPVAEYEYSIPQGECGFDQSDADCGGE